MGQSIEFVKVPCSVPDLPEHFLGSLLLCGLFVRDASTVVLLVRLVVLH